MPHCLMLRNYLALSFFFLCCTHQVSAQVKDKEPVKDSALIYKKIQDYSKRRGFTKFLHGLVFEPIRAKKKAIKARPKNVEHKSLSRYQGKIVRKINIVTLEPFGYSEKDTTAAPSRSLYKFGNRIHLKSKTLTIRNLLLIKRNKPLDSLLIQESERLVRAQRYIRGVVITPTLIENNPDSVDVNIRVLDSWSLIPNVAGSSNQAKLEVTERNFLGLGHRFSNGYERQFSTGRSAYSAQYTIPNLMNTYIQTDITYNINIDQNFNKSVSIERPFFSPFARWAGGAFFGEQFRADSLPDRENNFNRQNFKFTSQDLWGGYSYKIFRGTNEADRTTNFITTARYLNVDYKESPTIEYDSVRFYSDEKLYLMGFGIASRQYVEDKFIFNYGVVEDVPVGRAFGITGGRQEKNNLGRYYLGGRASFGRFYKWGYLSTNFEYGTFFKNATTDQSAFAFQASYFTRLLESGKWKWRQFIKTRVVIGVNREASWGDQITINENYGIPGFNSTYLFGTKKVVMTFQTQAYSPWNFAGFRLNPYFSYSMALLGSESVQLHKSNLYSQIGIGMIISNDFLVFSTFQLSLAFYPSIPGNGDNIFKTNAFNTEDFGFQNFEIAKPILVDYR